MSQGAIQQEDEFTLETLRQLLGDKFEVIKYESALEDIWEYVLEKPPAGWRPEMFRDTLCQLD